MPKLIAVIAFLSGMTSSVFAFDVAKCNQHCAEACGGKGNKCTIIARTDAITRAAGIKSDKRNSVTRDEARRFAAKFPLKPP